MITAISSLVVPLAIHFTTLIAYTKVVFQVVIHWKTQLGTPAFAATVLWIAHQVVLMSVFEF